MLSKSPMIGIALMVVTHLVCADNGFKGAWIWENNIAYTRFENGIVIGILFVTGNTCEKAALLVVGNNSMSKIALDVDGTTWGPVKARTSADGSFMELSRSALKGLKSGRNAAVMTDSGWITMSLDGSAAAFNGAWANCQAMVLKRSRGLEPEHAVNNAGPAAAEGSSGTPAFAVKDGNLWAAGEVVFFSGQISKGDDVRLNSIVEKMEQAKLQLKSVVFVNNPGGALSAAMRTGDLIREKRANTAATGTCASACIYAFSGGVVRTSYANTRFGLHQASYTDGSDGTLIEGQKIAARSYAYLEEKGVNPKIAAWEAEVEPDSMRWISQYEAAGLRLVTKITESHEMLIPEFPQ